jgi:hypothetical protein
MGLGLLISGVGATALGTMLLVAGARAVQSDLAPIGGEDIESDGPQFDGRGLTGIALLLGGLGTAAGLVMVPAGAIRLHRWRAWQRARPTMNRSAPGTWTVGFSLRF